MRVTKFLFTFSVLVLFIFSSSVFYAVSAQETSLPTVTSVQKMISGDGGSVDSIKPFSGNTGNVEKSSVSVGRDSATRKAEAVQNRETFRQEVMQKRQEAVEQVTQKRENFQVRVQEIQDQRKRELVERLDEKVSNMNQKRTDKMAVILDKLQSILDRINQRTDEVKSNGTDVSSVAEEITNAQMMIDEAKNVIADQVGKEYVFNLVSTDEEGVRNNVGTTITQFKADMTEAHKGVVAARQAVLKAAQELRKTVSEAKASGNGTPSGTVIE
ncbi:hypothetical protein C4577_04340 [Candidatus Parcubacteria bacterium]|nr:MAG: hypothetical protein C4577_04340 [Candidatus Parcubacteria bacterium]